MYRGVSFSYGEIVEKNHSYAGEEEA